MMAHALHVEEIISILRQNSAVSLVINVYS